MNVATLLVDIGNSRIKWAFVDAARATPTLDGIGSSPLDALPAALSDRTPTRIVYSNVASPTLAARALAPWPAVPTEEFRSSATAGGVINGYRIPERLGTDRWAALIGAHALEAERDLLVCTFGTATTVDLLMREDDGRARFVGGMILPGVDTMRRSLARDTARLPLALGTPTDFATDTDDAIASGIAAAQVGAVERAIARARARSPRDGLLVLLSGGAAVQMASTSFSTEARVEPDLVLRGLGVVAHDTARQYDAR